MKALTHASVLLAVTLPMLCEGAPMTLVPFSQNWSYFHPMGSPQSSDTMTSGSWSSVGVVTGTPVDDGSRESVTATFPKGTGTHRFARLRMTK